MKIIKTLILSIVLILANINISFSSDRFTAAGIENDVEAVLYFNKIIENIRNDRKCNIAKEIVFPIYVHIDHERKKIVNKKSFIEKYDKIFLDNFKNSILKQTSDDLFASWQGVSTSAGEIWFSLVKDAESNSWTFKIIAINNE